MAKTTLSEIRHLVSRMPHGRTAGPRNEAAPLYMGEGIPAGSSRPHPKTPLSTDPGTQNAAPKLFSDSRKPPVPPRRAPAITPGIEEELKAVEGVFTIRELSDRFHIPAHTLYQWARASGYKAKTGNRVSPISASMQEEILNRLDTVTASDLAKVYGIPYHALYYWMKKEGLAARKVSEFPPAVRKELREKCRTASLKALAREYGLSQQAMRSRLQKMGCFPDGRGGFLVVEGQMAAGIAASYRAHGLDETATAFHTTRTAVKSLLKKYGYAPYP